MDVRPPATTARSWTGADTMLIRHARPAEMGVPVGSVGTDRFREEAAAGRMRPEWTWFAGDGSRIDSGDCRYGRFLASRARSDQSLKQRICRLVLIGGSRNPGPRGFIRRPVPPKARSRCSRNDAAILRCMPALPHGGALLMRTGFACQRQPSL